ncbi:hypothetical protein Avbf_04131 [Armadillidium vulgare]|nr:hypothetical protein Avbf_04131 [Armadillidium vulgare]
MATSPSSPNGEYVTTCTYFRYSFAAGTTDGPGAFDFTQGMTEGNHSGTLSSVLSAPRPECKNVRIPTYPT